MASRSSPFGWWGPPQSLALAPADPKHDQALTMLAGLRARSLSGKAGWSIEAQLPFESHAMVVSLTGGYQGFGPR